MRTTKLKPIALTRRKKLKVTVRIEKIGRTKNGKPFVGVNNTGAVQAPTDIFIFEKNESNEKAIGELKIGETISIVGICVGKVDDNEVRFGKFNGWHVEYEKCQIIN